MIEGRSLPRRWGWKKIGPQHLTPAKAAGVNRVPIVAPRRRYAEPRFF
jgi:hypothetical protein